MSSLTGSLVAWIRRLVGCGGSAPAADAGLPAPWRDAMAVQSVHEEYEHVAGQRCPRCGGPYQVTSQALMESPDGRHHLDVLHVKCEGCGRETSVKFNIDAVWEQYGRMFGDES